MKHTPLEEYSTLKKNTPPYLSVTKIEELVKLVSNRNLSNVSAGLFEGYKFNKSDAILAVSTLKFLGVVNSDGQPTDLMPKLRLTGETGKKEFEKIVRAAYKKLFDATSAPQNLPTDELINEMVVQYGNISTRVAKSAVPAFFKFCEFAGLRAEGSVVSRKRGPKITGKNVPGAKNTPVSKKLRNRIDEAIDNTGFASIRVADGRMQLAIPSELKDRLLDDDKLGHDWHTLRTALRTFADKYISKETKSTAEEIETV